MRIFNKTEAWPEKVNFIDENGVLVGYDMTQLCYEEANWHIGDRILTNTKIYDFESCHPSSEEMKGWVFDSGFFEEIEHPSLEEGNMVVFRLIQGEEEKFLTLFNCHNGYYSHGFKMTIDEEIVREGVL